jgi:molybdate transport system substrate-binding protein
MSDVNVRILSADAPKTGLRKCAAAFADRKGTGSSIELATAPTIKKRVEAGDAAADVVVIPLAMMNELADAGFVTPESIVPLGSVTVGVVVRNGAREPDLTSVDTFSQSLRAADLVVYNTASSGLYIAGVLERLGLKQELTAKSVIVSTGSAVMERLAAETTLNAIGFGHVTEIRLHNDLGTHLVGPLPGAIGRETPYAAGVLASANPEAASDLVAFLGSRDCKQHFVEAGVM